MKDIIIIVLLAIIVIGSALYVYKEKKSGKRCIGCPNACACSAKGTENACSGCRMEEK